MFSGAPWKSLKAESRVRAPLLKHDYFIKILLGVTCISLLFHTCAGFISLLFAVSIFQKMSSKQRSRSLCHCLANLLKLDVGLLVPSS